MPPKKPANKAVSSKSSKKVETRSEMPKMTVASKDTVESSVLNRLRDRKSVV